MDCVVCFRFVSIHSAASSAFQQYLSYVLHDHHVAFIPGTLSDLLRLNISSKGCSLNRWGAVAITNSPELS